MSWFTDYRSHYFVGWMLGKTLKVLSDEDQREAIIGLDKIAWLREWKQNLAATNPNAVMSQKQQKEARAWGAGARSAAGITDLPYPSPPYPEGATWT